MRVVCTVPDDVLRERWRRRATTGERHPGHFDAEQESALDARLSSGAHNALDLPGERVEVDTSAPVDIAPLIALARTLSA